MIGRNRRGIRRASMRTRLAVAAAVLLGGGAAGAVAVAASHGGATAAQSAGYYTHYHYRLSEPHALSSAMNGWSHSPDRSLYTLSRMTPMRTFRMTAWHRHMLVIQRGTVVAAAKNQVAVRSAKGMPELWQLNRNTKILNVGGKRTGMAAMTGGTLSAPGRMDTKAKVLAPGDLVFIFGERENTTLKAQLVLFAVPMKPAPATTMTPAATPATMTTPSVTATPGMTTAPSTTATPGTTTAPSTTATPGTTTAPSTTATPGMTTAPVPTSTVPTFSGNNS